MGGSAWGYFRLLHFDFLSDEIESSNRFLTCFLRRLHERVSEILDILIYHEEHYRIIQRRLQNCWSGLAMDTAWKQLVLGKLNHGPLVVTIKL